MTDDSSIPVDLTVKRKRDELDEHRVSSKKKSRSHPLMASESPLDLSAKSSYALPYPRSTTTATAMPFYDPNNLFFNSSALLYDLFLANLNSYSHQQQPARPKLDLPKPTKPASRLSREASLVTSKNESFACSCGEKYSNVAQLVSHLKITNHSAQLSSTHDEVAKLVRGQDIWLSRDTNPANQILKCLRCSLSFETLPDLTAHMMKTNHFTQLAPSYSHSNPKPSPASPNKSTSHPLPPPLPPSRSSCLVCSQQFVREVDLVDHLQRLHQIRFNCTTCGMYFENENLYKDHLLKEMHHRNGKANRNRDYFLNQCKSLQKRTSVDGKSRSPVDKEIEGLTAELLDRISSIVEAKENPSNALSLLQSFVRKQSPPSQSHADASINDENSNLSDTSSSDSSSVQSNESPLASLEKMLAHPSPLEASLPDQAGPPKKKKFDKYRLFAEKMLRSTLS